MAQGTGTKDDPRQLRMPWYGLRKGNRGRFGMYLPPLLEALGPAELEHKPRSNRMRAVRPDATASGASGVAAGRPKRWVRQCGNHTGAHRV